MPGGDARAARRRTDRAARSCRSHAAGRGRGRDRLSRDDAKLRPGTFRHLIQVHHHREGPARSGNGPGGCHRRGRIPRRSSGAALHRAERRRRGAGKWRRHAVRVAAVSLLRPSRADRAARSSAGEGQSGPDRNGRRLRRKRRVSVDDCRPRRAGGDEVGPSSQADLRPRRGHAGDDEAPSRRSCAIAPA